MHAAIPLASGAALPDAPCQPDQTGATVCLKDFAGSWLVLYFYSKDNTSG